MKSYRPYENNEAQEYPWPCLPTGLHGQPAQYFEPAKWVAKLRAAKTDKKRSSTQNQHGIY
jgi:oligopeptidase B